MSPQNDNFNMSATSNQNVNIHKEFQISTTRPKHSFHFHLGVTIHRISSCPYFWKAQHLYLLAKILCIRKPYSSILPLYCMLEKRSLALIEKTETSLHPRSLFVLIFFFKLKAVKNNKKQKQTRTCNPAKKRRKKPQNNNTRIQHGLIGYTVKA